MSGTNEFKRLPYTEEEFDEELERIARRTGVSCLIAAVLAGLISVWTITNWAGWFACAALATLFSFLLNMFDWAKVKSKMLNYNARMVRAAQQNILENSEFEQYFRGVVKLERDTPFLDITIKTYMVCDFGGTYSFHSEGYRHLTPFECLALGYQIADWVKEYGFDKVNVEGYPDSKTVIVKAERTAYYKDWRGK